MLKVKFASQNKSEEGGVKVKRKYVRRKKSEEGEVKSKRKEKKVEPVEGEVARRRYRCDLCNYSSNNQVPQVIKSTLIHSNRPP